MTGYLVDLPLLPAWLQQLAGILPLTALIDFTDVSMKLHVFELYGSVPLWCWPITPAGARLLLSTEETSDACCLDRDTRGVVPLQCIDGRYGDNYPSSNPTTVRLSVASSKLLSKVANTFPNVLGDLNRTQKLAVLAVHLSKFPPRVAQARAWSARLKAFPQAFSTRYLLMTVLGWILWATILAFCLSSGLFVAAIYLVFMPVTGLIAGYTHGGGPRKLLDLQPCDYTRLVISTNSFNASQWYAFYGGSLWLNSLVNKPLYKRGQRGFSKPAQVLFATLILAQWILVVVSCAQQDYDALVISFWVFGCAAASSLIYTPEHSVIDWLKYVNGIVIQQIRAEFSSRRAMLSALVYLNPDSGVSPGNWLDPILADCQDRRDWQTALQKYIKTGDSPDEEKVKAQYWWKFIKEGVDMGRKIELQLSNLPRTCSSDL